MGGGVSEGVGLLEYHDMWTGLRSLNLIALALYLLSFWFLFRSQWSGARLTLADS